MEEAIRDTGSLRSSSSAGSTLSMAQARRASNSLLGSPPQRHRFKATARYNRPVSICGRPKCAASPRAMVPLPLAAGPSTAMTIARCAADPDALRLAKARALTGPYRYGKARRRVPPSTMQRPAEFKLEIS